MLYTVGEPEYTVDTISAYTAQCNKIRKDIPAVTDQKSVIAVYNTINALAAEYGETVDITTFRQTLSDKLSELRQQVEEERDRLNVEEQNIRQETYQEPIESLTELNTRADAAQLRLLTQLGNNRETNLKIIGEALNSNDRATGIALLRIAQMPLYASYMTPKAKERALAMSKSSSERKWEEQRDSRLRSVGERHAKAVMQAFHLRNTQEMIDKNNSYYFHRS